jgi:hypothetical protein
VRSVSETMNEDVGPMGELRLATSYAAFNKYGATRRKNANKCVVNQSVEILLH